MARSVPPSCCCKRVARSFTKSRMLLYPARCGALGCGLALAEDLLDTWRGLFSIGNGPLLCSNIPYSALSPAAVLHRTPPPSPQFPRRERHVLPEHAAGGQSLGSDAPSHRCDPLAARSSVRLPPSCRRVGVFTALMTAGRRRSSCACDRGREASESGELEVGPRCPRHPGLITAPCGK